MISKNRKVGSNQNVTLIELGDGDVGIGPVSGKTNDGNLYNGIAFENLSKRYPINHEFKEFKGKAATNTEVLLVFSNIQSLEVLEEAITSIKSELIKIQINKTKKTK
jgi:hypothetical protein